MMEAEKGSLVIGMGPSHRGWNGTTPLRAEPRGWNADIDHAWGYPYRVSTYVHPYNVIFVHCNRKCGAMPHSGQSRFGRPLIGFAEIGRRCRTTWRPIRLSD